VTIVVPAISLKGAKNQLRREPGVPGPTPLSAEWMEKGRAGVGPIVAGVSHRRSSESRLFSSPRRPGKTMTPHWPGRFFSDLEAQSMIGRERVKSSHSRGSISVRCERKAPTPFELACHAERGHAAPLSRGGLEASVRSLGPDRGCDPICLPVGSSSGLLQRWRGFAKLCQSAFSAIALQSVPGRRK
jgi:hypothetical protein